MNNILTERSVQGNKVSLIPDESEIKVVKIDTSLRQRRESRSSAKSQKPESNILTDGDKKSASFEDSRITLLLFEKYKTVELARFFTIAATLIITVLEYECSYKTQLTRELDDEIEQFLYLIMFFSIISIILTFISYQILMAYQKEAQIITPSANFTETPLVWSLIWEMILLILIPFPYTRHQKIEFQQRYSDTMRFYFLNEILTFFGMYKGFLLLNIVFKFQKYSSSSVGRICRLYSADFNTHLMLKLCIRDRPFETIAILCMVGMIVFGYSLEVAERALFRLDDSIDKSYLGNRFWINMITIFTVGYGDFFPYTDLGRVAMSGSVVYGVVVTSLFTATLYSLLTPSQGESLAWAVIDKAGVRKQIQGISGSILMYLNEISRNRQHFTKVEDAVVIKDKIENLNSLLSEMTSLKRQYRDIDGEEFMAMVKRKFKDVNGKFEDIFEYLDKISKQQKAINSNFEKQFDFSIKQSMKVIKEESKDDAFFENLNETLNCSHLMRFEEE